MRTAVALVGAAALALSGPASSGAATQVGEVFHPDGGCSGNAGMIIQSTSPAGQFVIPAAGVITSWRYQAGSVPLNDIRLKVARHVTANDFTITGQSALETTFAPNSVNAFQTRIPVQAGELLGIYRITGGLSDCATRGPEPGYNTHFLNDTTDPQPGSTATYTASGVTQEIDVAATLEPDCDNDGFGDETQDEETLSCPPGPDARITGAPADKIKTKKKRVSVTIAFDSNDPGATFNCVLDGQQEFRACTSPLTVAVKKGEHTFSVTATDQGGNAGAAASDTFKVKRKKKKRKK
jgi:hypothetical protein